MIIAFGARSIGVLLAPASSLRLTVAISRPRPIYGPSIDIIACHSGKKQCLQALEGLTVENNVEISLPFERHVHKIVDLSWVSNIKFASTATILQRSFVFIFKGNMYEEKY